MNKRLRLVGVFLGVAGLGFGVAGAVAYTKVQAGYDSLQAFSEQQNVTLTYNDDGQLIDRGETDGRPFIAHAGHRHVCMAARRVRRDPHGVAGP